jgi:hypothetical protein
MFHVYIIFLQLTIKLLFNHFDFVVVKIGVVVFLKHNIVVIPPLVSIGFRSATAANTQEVPTNVCGIYAEV